MTEKKGDAGKQMDLIDIAPENAKELIEAARLYKKYQGERLGALKKEVEQKLLIIELIHKAGLQELAGGKMKFEYDGVTVTVTPCDAKVKVKDKAEAEAEPEGGEE